MRTFIVNIDESLQGAEDDIDELERKWGAEEIEHKCHNCAHYLQGEYDGSCGSYICKEYSGWRKKMSCKDCHWFKDENPYEVMSNGKIYPCNNIGESGWEYWAYEQKEPAYCSQYCKKGTYKPTGIWAQMAKVVEAVAEVVENDNNNL